MRAAHQPSWTPLFGQLAVTLSAFGLMALWPSQNGKNLVVPLPGAGNVNLLTTVAHGGIRLVGSGPLDGSFVIEGDRALISRRLEGMPALLLAAPQSGCSESGDLK